MVSYYDILGIESTATDADIKKAYRKLAMKYHPDKNPEGADRFKEISHAYETLSDPNRRAAYDQYGPEGMPEEFNMDDLYQDFFHGGSGGGASFGFGSGPQRPSPVERHPLEVTLEDLYCGKKMRMKLVRSIPCKHCKGLGGRKSVLRDCFACDGKGYKVAARQVAPGLISQQQVSCQSCHGTGKVIPDKYRCKRCNGERVVDQKDTVEIKIERGSSDGQAIVLRGKGDQKPGQDPSDLVFVLRQKPHARFVRTGDDLTAEAEIDLAEALCGVSRVLVTQLDGRELEVTHRSGVIKPGDVVCIHNEGMPREKRPRDKGDLFIRFSIRFPDKTWRPNATLASLLPATKWPAPADDARVEVVTARPISAQEFESRTQPKHASYDYDGYAADTGPECQQQ